MYIRLSKEDAGRYARYKDESESVSNQREIIREHIEGYNDGDEYVIIDEYIDDGISGTTDEERDDFQRLLGDIERGRINCVIVKDLARSFRNYSDQGYYLDDWFPRHGTRFISLSHQALDSYKEPRNMRSIAVPFQGVMNENHCAETSEKIRDVFDMKRANGKHIGSFALYGYIKDPGDKNALIVDEYAAGIVKEIFTMFLDGMSKNAIVHHLNEHGVLCPAVYKQKVLGLKYVNPNNDKNQTPLWCALTVGNMLKNRMYCGDMVQGRQRVISYKVHIQENVPEDEWFIKENTHEPIIDRETFTKVQSLLLRDTRTGPSQTKLYLFSGFLRCADCGKAMTRSEVKGNVYYYCRTYKDQSKTACTKHTTRHNRLEAAVLYAIQRQIYLAVGYAEAIEKINKAPLQKSQTIKLNDAIALKEKELSKIGRYKQSIWQDWKDGEISQTEYRHMKVDYEKQAEALTATIGKLRAEKAELENGIDAESPFLTAFRQYQNIDKLTREVLVELVDIITVYENGNISVRFKFGDEFRKASEYIEINTHPEAV
jgi:DNA invertase Pin-like site-specific DNA recombinase